MQMNARRLRAPVVWHCRSSSRVDGLPGAAIARPRGRSGLKSPRRRMPRWSMTGASRSAGSFTRRGRACSCSAGPSVSPAASFARGPPQAGSNLIDVGASARGAAPAWNALRVTREVLDDLARSDRRDPRLMRSTGSTLSAFARRSTRRAACLTNCSAVTGSSAQPTPPRAATCGAAPTFTLPSPRPAEPHLAIGRGGNEPDSGTALLAVDAEGDPACNRPSAQP